jgi:hypothetical protein
MGFEKQNSRAEIAKKVEIYLFDVFLGLFQEFTP